MRRLKILAVSVALFFGLAYLFAGTKGGDELEEGPRGVRMKEVALAQLVPAVAARDVETGTCAMDYHHSDGTRILQMNFPAAAGEGHLATLWLDASGGVAAYSETHQAAAAITSLMIDVRQDSASVTNITEGGRLMTTGRGTADEVLRSEALGSPARRIEKILARCGRPGETN